MLEWNGDMASPSLPIYVSCPSPSPVHRSDLENSAPPPPPPQPPVTAIISYPLTLAETLGGCEDPSFWEDVAVKRRKIRVLRRRKPIQSPSSSEPPRWIGVAELAEIVLSSSSTSSNEHRLSSVPMSIHWPVRMLRDPTLAISSAPRRKDSEALYIDGRVLKVNSTSLFIAFRGMHGGKWVGRADPSLQFFVKESDLMVVGEKAEVTPPSPLVTPDTTSENEESDYLQYVTVKAYRWNEDYDSDPEDWNCWKVHCNKCKGRIRGFRYFCTYCERTATTPDGYDYRSFDLCQYCLQNQFPLHEHPRSSFAKQQVLRRVPLKNGYIHSSFVLDRRVNIDDQEPSGLIIHTSVDSLPQDPGTFISGIHPKTFAKEQLKSAENSCALCCETTTTTDMPFIPGSFQVTANRTSSSYKKRIRTVRVHETCAKASPLVYSFPAQLEAEQWANVASAVKRTKRCANATCHRAGASIPCFEKGCTNTFHLQCTKKPISYFEQGFVFWCPKHDVLDDFSDSYQCDACGTCLGTIALPNVNTSNLAISIAEPKESQLQPLQWMTCRICEEMEFYSTFDLCMPCFGLFEQSHPDRHVHEDVETSAGLALLQFPHSVTHPHPIDQFEITHLSDRQGLNQRQATQRAFLHQTSVSGAPSAYPEGIKCSYCWVDIPFGSGKRVYRDLLVCEACYYLAPAAFEKRMSQPLPVKERKANRIKMDRYTNLVDSSSRVTSSEESESSEEHSTSALLHIVDLESLSHGFYATRQVSGKTDTYCSTASFVLPTYSPAHEHWYTLFKDSTYFDIPGRCVRWASHSGSDYHGTWLPHTVRWSLLRYTRPGDFVLSNFLGRGTDAIESFLQQRHCCAVDVNPVAISLAQRNLSFAVPEALGISAEYRPILVLGDSRRLEGPLFKDKRYHHILSHPPYKDCVQYSDGMVEGDLSRIRNEEEFQSQMALVAKESYRLLKDHGYLTLGIGDNRYQCFYQPVSFQTLRSYMDVGFDVHEIILKRQRFCQQSPLGAYLSSLFDFCMFTHEFIMVLRKRNSCFASSELVEPLPGIPGPAAKPKVAKMSVRRIMPLYTYDSRDRELGSVWTIRRSEYTAQYSMSELALVAIVRRFVDPGQVWEEVQFPGLRKRVIESSLFTHLCAERDPPRVYSCEDLDDAEAEAITATETLSYEDKRERHFRDHATFLNNLGIVMGSSEGVSPSNVSLADSQFIKQVLRVPESTGLAGPTTIVIPHIPVSPTAILPNNRSWILIYRKSLILQARSAYEALCKLSNPSEVQFIVGVKDVRITPDAAKAEWNENDPSITSQFIPLGMLFLEDMKQYVPEWRLKELIVIVPEGYERNSSLSPEEAKKRMDEDVAEWERELADEAAQTDTRTKSLPSSRFLLPIVHAYYFVFKLK